MADEFDLYQRWLEAKHLRFSPDGAQVWNGRPHRYEQADHRDHVHVDLADDDD